MNKQIIEKFEEIVYDHYYYFFIRMLGWNNASAETRKEWMVISNQIDNRLAALGELFGHGFLHGYVYQSRKGDKIADLSKQAAREYLEKYAD
jgi:hypothetical protein